MEWIKDTVTRAPRIVWTRVEDGSRVTLNPEAEEGLRVTITQRNAMEDETEAAIDERLGL